MSEASVKITAIVAPYNEGRHIRGCLRALLEQQGVDGQVEIVVVDGMSADGTREIVRASPEYGTRVRMLDNPDRLQVYALNAGLRAARGEYVAFFSAHTHYGPRYLATCLEVMARTGAAAVGGVQRPQGGGAFGKAVAWCMSSPFGVGNARYRFADKEEEAESLFSIFTRRKTLEDLGGFDERFPYDEDSDISYRLRSAGGKLVVSPQIEIAYHVRDTLRGLCAQMYRYGYWRRLTQLAHRGRVPLRVYAPAALVAAATAAIPLSGTPLRAVSAAAMGAYAAFLLAAGAAAIPKLRARALLVPAVLAAMHISYGIGWWVGLLTFRSVPERAPRAVYGD